MLESVELTEIQQAELSNLGCDDLAARESITLETLRIELDKLKADTALEKSCRDVLSRSWSQTKILMTELAKNSRTTSDDDSTSEKGKWKENVPSPWSEVKNEDLPVAPVTTFNIIRLMQLGYIPVDKPVNKDGKTKVLSPTWIFYGPNALNLHGRNYTEKKMFDWAEVKSGVSFRTALDNDIAQVEKEIAKYKDATATHLDVKAWLQRQLDLLKSIKNERDPKVLEKLTNDYVKARSQLSFTRGAVGYNDPAPLIRKTQTQLDTEIARAETKTQATENFVKNTEKDLKAMTIKGELDSNGRTRETIDDINKKYDKAIQKKGVELQRELTVAEFAIKQPKIDYDNAHTAYKKVETTILDLQSKLYTAPTVKPSKANRDGLFPMTQGEINAELDKLWRIDSRWKPRIRPGQDLYLAWTELTRTKNIYDPLNKEIERLQKRLWVYKDSMNAKRTKEIDAFNTRKANLEKQLQQANIAIPKRQESQTHITELNNKIKWVETGLAAPGISASKRTQLEWELRDLYAQKNTQATTFENDVKSWSKNTRDNAINAEKSQIEAELKTLHLIDTELKQFKSRIDDIHKAASNAQNALRNERDPAMAKKLLDEMPGKINAWNQEIARQNQSAAQTLSRHGLDWKNIPDIELKAVLNGNPLLSSLIVHPEGALAKVTAMEQSANGQKVMKFAYGGLRWVAVAGAARTVWNEIASGDIKAAWLDALDAGMGFVGMVPVVGNVVSGAWDIGWATKQLITGTDINGRKVGTSQSFVRLGFGVVGLIPVIGNIAKWTKVVANSTNAVRAVDSLTTAANLTMKGAAVAQVGTLAYDVVDVTANMVRNPVDTAMKVIRWQEQNGIIFTKK